MASHRKPRTPLLQSPHARRGALSVTTAALASATLLSQSANAAPEDKPSIEEVKKRVDELYREAGSATQHYNAAKEETETQRAKVDRLLDQVAQRTDKLNEARRMLGTFAAAQYRNGHVSGTATLLLSEDPQGYFDQTHVMQRMTEQQREAVNDYQDQQRAAAEQRAQAAESLEKLNDAQQELRAGKKAVQTKLEEARKLLAKLTAEEKKRLEELERKRRAEARRKAEAEEAARQAAAEEQAQQEAAEQEQQAADASTTSTNSTNSTTSTASTTSDAGTSSRAQQVIEFARAQLGKPYVWGATGPNSYDCSGLTQAAWAAAGVSLPRVTYDQVNAGTTVTKSAMQPGDLVFFYNDVSHVGIYIGNGDMIHAPKPGDVVKVESIDYMPFYSAVRPA